VIGHDAIVCHVGDSRAYLLRDGKLEQLTQDQTMAQKMMDMGYDEEKVTDFHRILANYFGTGMKAPPHVDIHHIELRNDDRMLLCTDGLFKELNDEEICDHLTAGLEPQETCEAMLKEALDRGGRDNITMILAEIDP
jgi:protein phosphatase